MQNPLSASVTATAHLSRTDETFHRMGDGRIRDAAWRIVPPGLRPDVERVLAPSAVIVPMDAAALFMKGAIQ